MTCAAGLLVRSCISQYSSSIHRSRFSNKFVPLSPSAPLVIPGILATQVKAKVMVRVIYLFIINRK